MTGLVSRREALGLAVGLSATALLAWWTPGTDHGGDPTPTGGDRGPAHSAYSPGQRSSPADEDLGGTPQEPQAGPPTRLVIEAIGLDEPVQALGLTQSGEIEPPPGVVQWYTGSVAPGQPGHSVIAGHVTSPTPDVFHRLAELTVGDRVTVTDDSGTQRSFTAEATERVDKQELTTDPRVWGQTRRPVLVLITCDRDSPTTDGHHSGNVVVWATPTHF